MIAAGECVRVGFATLTFWERLQLAWLVLRGGSRVVTLEVPK